MNFIKIYLRVKTANSCESILKGMFWVRRKLLKHIINTRFGYGVVGLIIGMTSIIIFNEVSNHNSTEFSIKKVVYQAEVLRGSGDAEKSASYTKSPEQAVEPLNTEDLIVKYFGSDSATMLKIAKAESNLRPDAVNVNKNGTRDIGIFQINSVHGYDEEWLKIPENNVMAAKEVFETTKKERLKAGLDGNGFKAWSTYNFSIAFNKPI